MEYYLENKNNSHNKFYRIYGYCYRDKETGNCNRAFIGLCFGKIGSNGRTIFKEFDNVGDARDFAESKYWDKIRNSDYSLVNYNEGR